MDEIIAARSTGSEILTFRGIMTHSEILPGYFAKKF
jgi:hypothetical protein